MFLWPSDSDQRISVQFIILKSAQNGIISFLLRVSHCNDRIVLAIVPVLLRKNVPFSQRCREFTLHQFIPSSFSSVLEKAFSIYHKCNFTVLLASIWAQDGQWILEDTSHKSINSIFSKLLMVYLDPSLNVLNSFVFFKISDH